MINSGDLSGESISQLIGYYRDHKRDQSGYLGRVLFPMPFVDSVRLVYAFVEVQH